MNELKSVEKKFINVFGEDKTPAVILGNLDLLKTKDRIDFYNNVLNCNENIDAHFNEKLDIKYIYVAKQEIFNEYDPETKRPKVIDGKFTHSAPRMVFFTQDRKAYITFASGIYTCLKKIYECFGEPPYDFYIIPTMFKKNNKNIYELRVEEKKDIPHYIV